jgi:aminopeptidase N
MVRLFLILFISLSAVADSGDDNLTLELAKKRKSQIKSIHYELQVELKKTINQFNGHVKIGLELIHLKDNLVIDSHVTEIKSLKINGKEIKNFLKHQGNFEILKKDLAPKMTIDIQYLSALSVESRGIKKIKDAVDGEEYVYTDLEPFYAHWFFPCIDQPDFKSNLKLTVKAPSAWRIIHNELPVNETIEGDFKVTSFPETKPLSTYLYFLGAGPYEEWKDKAGDIPLYIHARKSMAKFVDAENLFNIFKKGISFYVEYFDHPYPYSKYGQIFVPDLPMNAIENAGAVTFHEMYLFLGPVTKLRASGRENIVLHEMAHMWFGDLVTMNWWNDLWLKEGFATYIASLAQDRAMASEYGRLDILNAKNWGYLQDTLVTTHPIESDIPDTRSSRGIFDGITYAKGASALKQLHFFVGEKGFKDGIRSYFKTYSHQNANRSQFINSIAKASQTDLTVWSQKWLQTAGVNRVRVEFNCSKNTVSKAVILQAPSSSGNISPHKVKLGLYKLGKNNLVLSNTIEIKYENEETEISEMMGKSCPDFIFPNQEDEDYALFSLDKTSLKHASLAITKLPDALSRFQTWSILQQMVKDLEISPKTFISMAKEALKFEDNEFVIGLLFARQVQLRDFKLIYTNYLTKEERSALAPDFEKILWQRVNLSKPGSSTQISFFDTYISIAQSKEAQEKILKMLRNEDVPPGVGLDPERRWRLFRNLAINGHKEALALIDEAVKHDSSVLARIMSAGARAGFPDLKLKKEIFKKLFERTDAGYSELLQAAINFNNPNTPELTEQFVDEYFEKITNLDWSKNDDFAQMYFVMFPGNLCTKRLEDLSSRKFKEAKNLTNLSRKYWLEAHDEMSKCVKVKTKKW